MLISATLDMLSTAVLRTGCQWSNTTGSWIRKLWTPAGNPVEHLRKPVTCIMFPSAPTQTGLWTRP